MLAIMCIKLLQHWNQRLLLFLPLSLNHKHFHQSGFICWLYKFQMVAKQIPATYPLYNIEFIFLGSLVQVQRTVMIMTAVVVSWEKRESHPLFITQRLVATLHSGLFSDTVSGEIGIWFSSTMDFSLCDCQCKMVSL